MAFVNCMLLTAQFSFSVKTKLLPCVNYPLLWSLLFFRFCPALPLAEAAF